MTGSAPPLLCSPLYTLKRIYTASEAVKRDVFIEILLFGTIPLGRWVELNLFRCLGKICCVVSETSLGNEMLCMKCWKRCYHLTGYQSCVSLLINYV